MIKVIKVITKKLAMAAIVENELTPGAFFGVSWPDPGTLFSTSSKTCEVCAVGAIMRAVSLTKIAPTAYDAVRRTEDVVCKGGATPIDFEQTYDFLNYHNYLAALSCVYEGFDEGTNSKEVCLSFIAQHFPESFEVEV